MSIKTIVRRLHGIYSLLSNVLSAPDPVIRASSLCILMAVMVDISFQLPEQALRFMVSVFAVIGNKIIDNFTQRTTKECNLDQVF